MNRSPIRFQFLQVNKSEQNHIKQTTGVSEISEWNCTISLFFVSFIHSHPFKISRVFLPFSSITYCVYVSNFIRLYLLMHKEFPRGGWRQEEKKKEREKEKGTRKGNVKTRITPCKLGNFDLHDFYRFSTE